jgi:hypothetical protein
MSLTVPIAQGGVPSQSCRLLPGRDQYVPLAKEKRMTMLADQVDIVIGVDTHKCTHTGAAVMAKTGAALEDRTVPVGPDGYQELLGRAEQYGVLRAWAVEGTAS